MPPETTLPVPDRDWNAFVWGFWMEPGNFSFYHSEDTHCWTVIEEMDLVDKTAPDGLEDDAVIAVALRAGWVRGRYDPRHFGPCF